MSPSWFQDAYNIDLRNIEMDAVRVGTEEGLISFCAYLLAGLEGDSGAAPKSPRLTVRMAQETRPARDFRWRESGSFGR